MPTVKVSADISGFESAFQRASRLIENQGRQLTGMATRYLGAAAAVEIARRSFLNFASVDLQLRRIGIQAGLSSKYVQAMVPAFAKFSAMSGESVENVADSFNLLRERARLSWSDTQRIFPTIVQGAYAANVSLRTMAETFGAMMLNLNIGAGQAGRAMDVLYAAIQKGNINLERTRGLLPEVTTYMKHWGAEGVKAEANLLARMIVLKEATGDEEEALRLVLRQYQRIGDPRIQDYVGRAPRAMRNLIRQSVAEGRDALDVNDELYEQARRYGFEMETIGHRDALGHVVMMRNRQRVKDIAAGLRAEQEKLNSAIIELRKAPQEAINELSASFSSLGRTIGAALVSIKVPEALTQIAAAARYLTLGDEGRRMTESGAMALPGVKEEWEKQRNEAWNVMFWGTKGAQDIAKGRHTRPYAAIGPSPRGKQAESTALDKEILRLEEEYQREIYGMPKAIPFTPGEETRTEFLWKKWRKPKITERAKELALQLEAARKKQAEQDLEAQKTEAKAQADKLEAEGRNIRQQTPQAGERPTREWPSQQYNLEEGKRRREEARQKQLQLQQEYQRLRRPAGTGTSGATDFSSSRRTYTPAEQEQTIALRDTAYTSEESLTELRGISSKLGDILTALEEEGEGEGGEERTGGVYARSRLARRRRGGGGGGMAPGEEGQMGGGWRGGGVGEGTLQGPQGAEQLQKELGLSAGEYNAYRQGMADIESSGGRYGLIGGAGNRYSGAYQFGPAEIAETAKRLGEPVPTREQFLSDPAMQERYMSSYTLDHHRQLMKNPKYAAMSPREKLAILGYAHNQGVGGALNYLNTGQVGRDAFRTPGTRYGGAIRSRLAQLDRGGTPGSGLAQAPTAGLPAGGANRVEEAQLRSGAERNQPITPATRAMLQGAAEATGVRVRVTSGMVGRGGRYELTKTGRHVVGAPGAADFELYDENNRKIPIGSPKHLQFLEEAAKRGAMSGGAGIGYMGRYTTDLGMAGSGKLYRGTPAMREAFLRGRGQAGAFAQAQPRRAAVSSLLGAQPRGGQVQPQVAPQGLSTGQRDTVVAAARQLLGKSGGDKDVIDFLQGRGDPRKQQWCATFVNAVLARSGVEGTGSPMARSFTADRPGWSAVAEGEAKAGDIVTMNPEGGAAHHSGIFTEYLRDAQGNITGIKMISGDTRDYANPPPGVDVSRTDQDWPDISNKVLEAEWPFERLKEQKYGYNIVRPPYQENTQVAGGRPGAVSSLRSGISDSQSTHTIRIRYERDPGEHQFRRADAGREVDREMRRGRWGSYADIGAA